MLKRFIVENFSSYRDESILELTAGRTEIHTNHLFNFSKQKVKLLKSAVIYGANASGKSNLIKAVEFAKNIIVDGLRGQESYKKYFRLDNRCHILPTQFEFELEIDNKFYSYGFSFLTNKKEIVEEWLFEIGKSSDELIFERKKNKIKLGKVFLKKSAIKNRFEIYKEDIENQPTQLFLSEIANKNLEFSESKILNDIYQWFSKKLVILHPNTPNKTFVPIMNKHDLLETLKKLLQHFDTGIEDIVLVEDDFEEVFRNVPVEIKIQIEKDLMKKETIANIIESSNGDFFIITKDEESQLKVQRLGLKHTQMADDLFELKDESDGTKRLFDLIPLTIQFSNDSTVLIDEFDRSLHPKLAKTFLELFYETSSPKSQLIVTTHESTLLDLTLVRKDEIWFTEKDKEGASKLFTLNQFKERYDKKIDKAYLSGKYGAIPIFKEFEKDSLGKK